VNSLLFAEMKGFSVMNGKDVMKKVTTQMDVIKNSHLFLFDGHETS
jgi:hypothetical protein